MQASWSFKKAQPYEDAEYNVEYELAYFCLIMRLDPAYVGNMSEKEKAAWVEAYNDIQTERNKA